MENILDLVTLKLPWDESSQDDRARPIRSLRTTSYPFRICDIPLPQCKSGFVYFLISVRTRNFTYIGECRCIVSRLAKHNKGYGSSSTTPLHRRPYAIFGYIAGFNNAEKRIRRHIEQKWKDKRDFLISQGCDNPREWFRSGVSLIDELDDSFATQRREIRLVELFRD